jgi:SagB-type dehydrogenase family enzyme
MMMRKTIGQEFMKQTYPQYLGISPQAEGVPQPPLELAIPANAHLIPLPPAHEIQTAPLDLRSAMEERRSIRQYSDQPVSLEELSLLLWLTQGVKRVTERPITKRTVPSAGGRHSFETFILVNRVTGLQPGIYRFAALEHALVEVDLSPAVGEQVYKACLKQSHVQTSAVSFFWAAIAERMLWRYVERGYRYLLLDAGHICQNLYLAASLVGCGTSSIASFIDDDLNRLMGLDGEKHFIVYGGTLGKRDPNQDAIAGD